jgi:hypothetical protein
LSRFKTSISCQDDEAQIQADRLASLLEEEGVHMEQLQSMRISSLALKKLIEMAHRSFHLGKCIECYHFVY